MHTEPRAARLFCLHVFRRGPVNVAVMRLWSYTVIYAAKNVVRHFYRCDIANAIFAVRRGGDGRFIALSLGGGGLALFAGPEHRNEILRTLAFSLVGFFIGSAMRPIGAYGSLAAHAIPVAMGIIGCAAFGSLAFRIDRSEPGDAG